MKELIEYTDEFECYDPKKPFVKTKYRILISNDNSIEKIDHKFQIDFLNSENEIINEIDINSWKITYLH